MAHRAIRRAFKRDVTIFLAVLGAEALLSIPVSGVLHTGYLNAFHWLMIDTGAVILIVSAIEGSGAPEMRLAQSPMFDVSASYQETVVRERISEEQEGF